LRRSNAKGWLVGTVVGLATLAAALLWLRAASVREKAASEQPTSAPSSAEEPAPDDAALAREALARGDLRAAVHHISLALSRDPTNAEWEGVLMQIIERSSDPLSLLPEPEEQTSFATAAVRSYILAARGRWEEAIDILGQVAVVRPDVPYLRWCERWLGRPTVLQRFTFEELAASILVPVANLIP
jgi:hypothetical protein